MIISPDILLKCFLKEILIHVMGLDRHIPETHKWSLHYESHLVYEQIFYTCKSLEKNYIHFKNI